MLVLLLTKGSQPRQRWVIRKKEKEGAPKMENRFDLIGKKENRGRGGCHKRKPGFDLIGKIRRRRKNQNKNPGFDFVEEVVPGVVLYCCT